MANKIICIARQFGSGGHEIAVRAGIELGIHVYEKDLLHLACEYGEISEKMMESADETATIHIYSGLSMREIIMLQEDFQHQRFCSICKAMK